MGEVARPCTGGSARLDNLSARRCASALASASDSLPIAGSKQVPGELQRQRRIEYIDAPRDGKDGILFRHDDAVLAEHPVSPVRAMPAAPELIAVALRPIALRAGDRPDPRGRRLRNPGFREQSSALPDAPLQIELAEARDLLGGETQPDAAHRDPLRGIRPRRHAEYRAAQTSAAPGNR